MKWFYLYIINYQLPLTYCSKKRRIPKNVRTFPHLPYSLNLELCDFWLFHYIKTTMKVNVLNQFRCDSAAKDTHERKLPGLLQNLTGRRRRYAVTELPIWKMAFSPWFIHESRQKQLILKCQVLQYTFCPIAAVKSLCQNSFHRAHDHLSFNKIWHSDP